MQAFATIDENGSISNVAISEDLDTGEKSFGRGYFNTDINNKPTVVAGSHRLDGLLDFRDANVLLLRGMLLEILSCADHKHMDRLLKFGIVTVPGQILMIRVNGPCHSKGQQGNRENCCLDGGSGYVD